MTTIGCDEIARLGETTSPANWMSGRHRLGEARESNEDLDGWVHPVPMDDGTAYRDDEDDGEIADHDHGSEN